jgi:cytochrome c553
MRQSRKISKLNFPSFLVVLATLFVPLANATTEPAKPATPATPAMAAAPAPAAIKADTAAGDALYNNGDPKRGVVACVGCHGANGNSGVASWPKLAAQHSAYTLKQLKNYKDGSRANPVMMGMVATLTQQDMLNLAAYLNKQQPTLGVAQNKDSIALGQKIYRGGIAEKGVPACAGCHSPNGAGIPAQYPRLSGQWADYSTSQLVAFREGTRKNSAQMTTIATKLSDAEMKAVSDYMAGLR